MVVGGAVGEGPERERGEVFKRRRLFFFFLFLSAARGWGGSAGAGPERRGTGGRGGGLCDLNQKGPGAVATLSVFVS